MICNALYDILINRPNIVRLIHIPSYGWTITNRKSIMGDESV